MTEPSLSIELCGGDESHARQVMTWRNDPTTLTMSFHREPKSWERFWPEYRDEYLSEPGLPPLFLLDGGARVGFLRFRPIAHPQGLAGRVVDISLMIAPDRRGTGLGKAALRAGLDFLRRSGVDSAVAEIRTENAASVACFAAAGFVPLDEVDKRIPDTGETCRIARSLYELTSAFWRRDRVFVIAEAGSNWRMGTAKRDLAMGKALIEVAAEAGADAVKFQTFAAERIVVPGAPKADYQAKRTGATEDQLAMLRRLELDQDSHVRLAALCQERGIEFMSTAFDELSLDFLIQEIGIKRIKVPSGEMTNGPLLLRKARAGLPLLVSTGMCTLEEVREALGVLAFGLVASDATPPSRTAFQAALIQPKARAALAERATLLH
ncbi:MAG: GNAT family N-acetyltransferase, partial [Kiloniellales bacterium]|nr:GNAT family N-acetyltransferase [Kiloniellales bacterium]